MQTPIDVLAGHLSKFFEMSNLPTLERQIAREGVILYERDGFSQQMA
jgi:hypothetical protein